MRALLEKIDKENCTTNQAHDLLAQFIKEWGPDDIVPVVVFQRATICNETTILDYFINTSTNPEKVLLDIIKHCSLWNRAGATYYALTKLNPNRSLQIMKQTENKNLKQEIIYQDCLTQIYNFLKERCDSALTRSPN